MNRFQPPAAELTAKIITDALGNKIGYVAYNGRVFPGRPLDWNPGVLPLYHNRAEAAE
jgi:hypothetical protein